MDPSGIWTKEKHREDSRKAESRPEFQVDLNLENQVVWKYMKVLCPKSKQLDGCYLVLKKTDMQYLCKTFVT